MEQQRSMMMSRAMSQRSVVIRPATQETGGMMQYLLTIVFLICTFWVVVGVLYFIYGKRGVGKTTPEDDGGATTRASCPGTADGARQNLLPGKTIICSVRQSNAFNLWLFVPEGVCNIFVALGLTQSDGSVQKGLALSVERLRAVDKAAALVSVDYAVLTTNTDNFGRSLNSFMSNVPSRFKRKFDGIEVRGIPVADYLVDNKMSALNAAIGTVKAAVTQVKKVVVTVAVPLSWQAPAGKLAMSNLLTNADWTVAQIHYLPVSGSCTARPSNSISRMSEVKPLLSTWRQPCMSMMLGAIIYNGAAGANQASQSCSLYAYCKALSAQATPETIADAGSLGKRAATGYIIYDTPQQIEEKVRIVKDMPCLYVDNIDLDDAKCTCQKTEQFPLLSRVRRGLL